jgi:hypothetical protein
MYVSLSSRSLMGPNKRAVVREGICLSIFLMFLSGRRHFQPKPVRLLASVVSPCTLENVIDR